MKCWATIVLCLLTPLVWAQQAVQTLVPKQNITVGEAFQVQYVVYDLEGFQQLQTPDFGAQFKVVNGPVMYSGNLVKGRLTIPVQNFTYTLVPLQKGVLTIAGATAVYSHKHITSPSVYITSNQKSNAANQNKTAPSLNNSSNALLVRAELSKKECYVGEPVVATFTLLSRVVTAAEVIKNPGFYGFSVVEMSKSFKVPTEGSYTSDYEQHVLRRVQLYPMQSGKLVIDEMTVHNVVQSVDATGTVTQEEVILNSAPMAINVKPLPASSVQNFTGAVGRFVIAAELKPNTIMAGRTGKLTVSLSGGGNFLQLPIPEVAWPAHVEGFEPVITEDLYKYLVPVAGKKQYEYNFTADSMGTYIIPPVLFTYFDLQAKKYKTISTDSLHLNVTEQKGFKRFLKSAEQGSRNIPYQWLLPAIAVLVILMSAIVIVQYKRGKKKRIAVIQPQVSKTNYVQQLQNLAPAQKDLERFYTSLQQIVLQFLKEEYGIYANASGTVVQQLAQAPFTPKQIETLQAILDECERVQYYNAVPQVAFTTLQQKAIEVVSSLQK